MIDYLDKPPQRYDHVFQKNSGSREMVEDPQGEYVKYDDMDLYMFEGSEFMKLLAERVKFAETLLLRAGVNGPLFQEYASRYPMPMQWTQASEGVKP